ncbi:MAG: hypothetical protein IKN17_00365, partial [Ruminococcus sp.]|nr:hypothetical protein [Ruminococcus sp.]
MTRAMSKRMNKILSIITAFLLALSTFGGVLTAPLFAHAADSFKVRVEVKNKDGSEDQIVTYSGYNQGSFVLATLKDAETDEIIGWRLERLTPRQEGNVWHYEYYYNEFPKNVEFTEFYTLTTGSVSDTFWNNPRITYDAGKHTVSYRVYSCDGTQGHEWFNVQCYNDCVGTDTDPAKVKDSFDGYVHDTEVEEDGTNVFKLTQKDVAFNLEFDMDVNTDIPAPEKYYALVEVSHSSSAPTYFCQAIDLHNQTGKQTFSVQTPTTENWLDSNGNPTDERFNGKENGVVVKVVQALTNDATVADMIAGNEKIRTFGSSCIIKDVNVVGGGLFVQDSDSYALYTIPLYFGEIPSEDLNFLDLLGEGANIGFVADRYQYGGHTETNIAVNHYEGYAGNNVDSDICGLFGGHYYVSNFVKFAPETITQPGEKEGETVTVDNPEYVKYHKNYSYDPDGKLEIGERSCPEGIIVHLTSDELLSPKPIRSYAVFEEMTAKDMTEGVIEPIIANMQKASAKLIANKQNINLIYSNQGKAVLVDGTELPNNATIYVDGDAIKAQLEMTGSVVDDTNANGLKIKIKEGQTVVFNFDSTDKLTLAKYGIEIYDKDGDPIEDRKYGDGTTQPASYDNVLDNNQNTWLEEVSKSVIWNCASVSELKINSSAGVFLVPKDLSDTYIEGSSSGWFITDGFVRNNAEWHFTYSGVPGTTSPLTVTKYDINGRPVSGAKLEIRNAEDDSLVRKWTADTSTTEKTNPYSLSLAPGEYILKETGFDTALNSTEYELNPFELRFRVVDDSNYTAKTFASHIEILSELDNSGRTDGDKTTGYYMVWGQESDNVGVYNAFKQDKTKVDLSKSDVTGQPEVVGAHIEIYKVSDLDSAKTFKLDEWDSDGTVKTFELAEGTYILRETDASELDGYKIIDSDVVFKVETVNNKKTVTVISGTSDGTSADDQVNGYVKFTNAAGAGPAAKNASFRFCDAEEGTTAPAEIKLAKTDIAGTAEIDGAEITIFDDNGRPYISWVSGSATADNTISLPDGKYTMKETGIDNTLNSKSYKVIESEISFEVKDGKVTNVQGTSNGSSDADKTNGYVSYSENGDVFTFNDAEKLTDVTLRKTDITGLPEVLGAKIKITRTGTDKTWEWVSDGKTKTFQLSDGSYTMQETAVEEGANDVEYKIIDSTISFTVKNGEVTSVSGVTTDNGQSEEEQENGFVSYERQRFTFNDAEAAPKTADIVLRKTDIAGTDEVLGARIVITKAGSTEKWEWVSDGRTKTFTLTDGSYTMQETGIEEGANTVDYKIIESSVTFDIVGGQVQNVQGVINAGETGDAENGYVSYSAANNGFTFNDAEVPPASADITLKKTDIAGDTEVLGAQITITNVGTKETHTWVSNGEEKTFTLTDGSYTMQETGIDTDANPKSYKIIDSTITFDIIDGVVKNVSGTSAGTSAADKEKGFVSYSNNKFTFNDAEQYTDIVLKKTDIAGSAEIIGAKIEILDANNNNAKVHEWVSDGKEKTFSLSDGSYIMQETGIDNTGNALSYKVIPSSIEFTVKNGEITSVSGTSNGKGPKDGIDGYVSQDGNKFTFNDAEKKTAVELSKVAVVGSGEVEGAVIEVMNLDTKEGFNWISGESEKTFELSDGRYSLTETGIDNDNTDNGKSYKIIDSTVIFTVKDGTVTVESGTVENPTDEDKEKGYVSNSGNKFTFNDAELFTEIEVNKTDIAGSAEVKGAKIEILDLTGTPVDSWVSDGKTKTFSLSDGQYILKESAIDNDQNNKSYKIIGSEILFTVHAGEVVSAIGTSTGTSDEDRTNGYVSRDGNTFTFNDAEQTTDVTLRKTDIAGTTEVLGAKIRITGDNIDVVYEWVSDGKTKTFSLSDGSYTMKETAVDNETGLNDKKYKIVDSEIKFTVKNGEITSVSGTSDGSTDAEKENGYVSQDGSTFTFNDAELPAETTEIVLRKTDIAGSEEVIGAKIKITNTETQETIEWVSDGSDKTVTLADGTYTMEETAVDNESGKNSKSYKIIPSTITFTVSGGTVTDVQGTSRGTSDEDRTNGYVSRDGNTFTFNDAELTTDITLRKTDIAGTTEVLGAKIRITGDDIDVVYEWVSDGKTKTFSLSDGSYTMKETAVDNETGLNDKKYKIVDSEIKFTVKNGEITSVSGTSDGSTDAEKENGYVSQDGSTFTFNDAELPAETTEIVLRKTDIAGSEEVIGAKIKITNTETQETVEWVSDGSDKTVTLADGTYTMEETAVDNESGKNSKSYKIVPSTITFTVSGGTVTDVQGTSRGTSDEDRTNGYVSRDGNTFTFNDAELTTDITLRKTDIAGTTEVLGAKIIITKDGTDEKFEWESDGKTRTFTLSDGNYTMKETAIDDTANDALYKIVDSEIKFTVNDGKIKNVIGTSDGKGEGDTENGFVSQDGSTFTFNDAIRLTGTTDIVLRKTDIAGSTEVIGAVITITNDTTGESITWVSDGEDKTVTLENGTYTMTETDIDNTKNDKSYKIIPSTITFTVNEGTVSNVQGTSDGQSQDDKDQGYVSNDGNTFTFNDAELFTEIELSKTDIAGTNEVLGARIVITKEGSNETWEWISDGQTKTFTLSDGTYTMKETGIDQTANITTYRIIDSEVVFKVKGGDVRVISGTSDGRSQADQAYGYVYNDGRTFRFNDAEDIPNITYIEITKTDIVGASEVIGARITITNDVTGDTIEWISGDSDRIVALEDGSYTMTEVSVDNELNTLSYRIVPSTVNFTVSGGTVSNVSGVSDGRSFEDKQNGFVTNDGNKFRFNDAELLTEIELSKTDIAGTTEVLGARIVITKEGSNETWEWISDGETKYFSLSDGNYTMKETGIDNSLNELSYKIVNQTVTFTVKNGMVRNVRGTSDGTTPGIENYGFVTNEGNAFNFNDAELTTVIELAKTDITGSTEVLGAQIEITNTQTGDTLTWVSGDEERFFTLSDGTYTLKETAVDNDLNELDYAIVEQTVEFEIKEGKVINITGISDGTGEHDEVDGFVTFDDE